MRKLARFDIMDYVLYEERRAELRQNIARIKEPRRIFLGEKVLFLFENTEMVRDHVLETIWVEKLFSERDLMRQLEIFNPLIANQGELRCTMIILGNADWERPKRMKPWKELSSHIYLILNDGRKVYAQTPESSVINQHPGTLQYSISIVVIIIRSSSDRTIVNLSWKKAKPLPALYARFAYCQQYDS